MKILVYEHVSGGGFAGTSIPADILCEGFAMLRTLIHSLKTAGHSTATLLDARIMVLNPPIEADSITHISSPGEVKKEVWNLLGIVDAAYIIAPESDGILAELVSLVEKSGKASLNCSSEAIKRASDKAEACKELTRRGLPIPETVEASVKQDIGEIRSKVKDIGVPVVFKPINGVGCAGLSLVKSLNQIPMAVERIKHESSEERFLIQKYIRGTSASVSLIASGQKAMPIILNRQRTKLAAPNGRSAYLGGSTPMIHTQGEQALEITRRAVESFEGLRGYVGVDVVLTGDKAIILEVNPRLTTSFIGIEKIINFNLAQAIIDAAMFGRLPEKIQTLGFAVFQKVETPVPKQEKLQSFYRLGFVATPPFPINQNDKAYALIEAHAATLKAAMSKFYRVKRLLLKMAL
jgi:predicted ATP-grasp superfamily ATP-dependent carboligase